MARQAISKFYQRDQQEEGREDCRFEALPSHGRNRSVGSEGSQPAGVLDSVSELGRIGNSFGEVESVLPQRLAPACDDGSDLQPVNINGRDEHHCSARRMTKRYRVQGVPL